MKVKGLLFIGFYGLVGGLPSLVGIESSPFRNDKKQNDTSAKISDIS